jgi:fatty acyl-CoA reductase
MDDSQPDTQTSAIAEFYNQQCVLVTGATGFMGRMLVEKLLRCSLQLRTLYVLVRAQRGKSADERMAEILQEKVFDKLREMQPDFSRRITVCEGDVMRNNMGLSDLDMEVLVKNVTVVFHCAATIKFDDPLKISVKMNVGGVQSLLAVCHALQNLKALVHVSTAFSNCDRTEIDEAVYPPSIPPNKLMEALDWMDDDIIETLTPKLIGRRPNTYTFSKSLAEYVLVQEGKGLPLAIFRPSIVGASWKEPTPGWVGNTNGPTGLFIAIGKGFMRVMRVNMDSVADIVPVDVAINMMIAIGWYTATAHPTQCLVYHCTTGGQNPFTWKEMAPIVLNTFHQYPYDQIIRRPRFHSFTNTYAWFYWRFVNHVLPAYIIDFFSRLSGKRPV